MDHFQNSGEVLPQNFVRCHKSYIVNIDNISKIDVSKNIIEFKNSSSLPCYIGPKYKNNFMEVLKKYEYTK